MPARFSSDGSAYDRSIRMGFGILDIRCGSRGVRSRLFCVRELRDTGLWRRASGGTLAATWPSNRDERHVAIWMVDRGLHPRCFGPKSDVIRSDCKIAFPSSMNPDGLRGAMANPIPFISLTRGAHTCRLSSK